MYNGGPWEAASDQVDGSIGRGDHNAFDFLEMGLYDATVL